MDHQQKVDVGFEALKATPPVAYLGATFGGLSLPDWAALLAIIYTLGLLFQMGHKATVWIIERWQGRKPKRNRRG